LFRHGYLLLAYAIDICRGVAADKGSSAWLKGAARA
jgi:hypothetical protein